MGGSEGLRSGLRTEFGTVFTYYAGLSMMFSDITPPQSRTKRRRPTHLRSDFAKVSYQYL